jgi:hypothetical protein
MATLPRDNEHLARLLARTAARDHTAFTELYELTSAHCLAWRCVYCIAASAEEVLQDTYVSI